MTEYGFITTLKHNAFQENPELTPRCDSSYVCQRPGELRYVRQFKRWNSPKAFTAVVCIHPNGRADGSLEIAVHIVEAGKIILSGRYKTYTGTLNFLARTVMAMDATDIICIPCPWEINKKERSKWERLNLIPA